MIISNLKLVYLGHCFIHLPKSLLHKINVGSIVTIRSVNEDSKKLQLIWNGAFTENDETFIDISLGHINDFKEETIVIDLAQVESRICKSVQVQLLDSKQLDIINEHVSANMLDRCRLVYKDLKIPIWLSDHVKVSVQIIHTEPIGGPVELNEWTEMQIQNVPNEDTPKEDEPIKSFIPSPCHIRINLLITGARGSGKTHQLKKLAKKFNIDMVNCKQLRGKRLESIKKQFEDRPSILLLDDIDAIVGMEEKSLHHQRIIDWFCSLFKDFERSDKDFHSIICTCQSLDGLDPRLAQARGKKYFTYVKQIDEPNSSEKIQIIKEFLDKQKALVELEEEEMQTVASLCKNFSPMDLCQLVERTMIQVCSRSLYSFNSDPVSIRISDFKQGLEGYIPMNMRDVNLKPKSLRTFDHIGGMHNIKQELRLILQPLKYPKLYSRSPIKPQTSVLLYGPPGCGKTLIADALTNQADVNSIYIRGPELLSKYIGSSEAAVRDLFKKAYLARPCIIFFDEFESLVPRRGSDSTGVTDRVVNQFLTLMDGFEELSHEVFIVAATSRPDMIDSAILRPGRIDKHIYCAYPDFEDRLEILRIMSNNVVIKDFETIDEKIARSMEYFTGADIQSVMYSAQIKALDDIIGGESNDKITRRNPDNDTDGKSEIGIKIIIEEKHLLGAIEEIVTNVKSKYNLMVARHPKDFNKLINNVVSSRATLM